MMSTNQAIPCRPLGLIIEVLEKAGFASSHVYEDLIFPDHNAFLLRMEDIGSDVSLYFNEASEQKSRDGIASVLKINGLDVGLRVTFQGTYRLVADETSETIQIVFAD